MEAQGPARYIQKESSNPGSSRRYACDRCRGHKLRCNRDIMASGNGPCHRCIKAKAKCTMTVLSRSNKPLDLDGEGGIGHGEGVSRPESYSYPDREIVQSSEDNLNSQFQPSQQSDFSESANTLFGSAFPLPQISTNAMQEPQDHNNSLQLASVPWMDLDMNAEGSASAFEFGTNLVQSSYASDNYGLNVSTSAGGIQTFDGWNDINTLATANCVNGTVRSDELPAEYLQSGLSPTQHSLTNSNIAITGPESTSAPALTPEDQKEVCIQRLSDLSASIMKNLNRLMTCTVATSFIFTPSDHNTAEYLFKTIDGSSGQDNAIGKVLHSTEEFLKILHDFRQPLLDVAPLASVHQEEEGRETNSFPNSGDAPGDMIEANGEEESLRRWELLHSYKDRTRHHISANPQSILPDSSSSPSNPSHLSVPSTLTLLTCYTGILKSFENIFLSLQRWLSVPASSPLHAQVAPIIAGVQINGFALDNHSQRSLQLKILVQVCQHMLDKVERVLWFNPGDGDGRNAALAGPVFQGLLQVLLKQEGLESHSGDEDVTGMRKVRALLEKVIEELK